MNKKLESWCDQLLDMGKRNNLINFHDSKSMTIELVYPESERIFEKVESSSLFEVFDPRLSDEEEDSFEEDDLNSPTEEDIIKNALVETEVLTMDKESEDEEQKKNAYIASHIKKLKRKNQVLAYNPWKNPLTVIKSIDRKSSSLIEETGVNVAYMAFGFIHWKENEVSKIEYQAPILLAPIKFRNENAISPYFIQMSEDDIIVNPTFSQKLKSEFGLSLPNYEEGELSIYLVSVEELISKLGWTISSECKIGIFSFLKLNMYEDIKQHEQEIMQNTNIRALLGEVAVAEGKEYEEIPADYHVKNVLVDIHNVLDADSSQLEAIQLAKSGKSFVLQGPPGTGKSQTITNIIAECLHDGKRVLFVSEKQAALNVVFNRLKQVELADFCLELHSHKANKKEFINELNRTLNLSKQKVSDRAMKEIEQKVEAQNILDEYERELHKQREVIGKSLYELYELYAHFRNAPEIDFFIDHIENMNETFLQKATALLDNYAKFTDTIGYDYRKNTWFGYKNPDASFQAINELKRDLGIAYKSAGKLEIIVRDITDKFSVSINSFQKMEIWVEILRLIVESDLITPLFLRKENFHVIYNEIKNAEKLSGIILERRSTLLSEYDKDILKIDGADNFRKLTRQFQNPFSRMTGEYKKIITDIRLLHIQGKKLKYEETVSLMKLLKEYQEANAEFAEHDEKLREILGNGYKGIESSWEILSSQLEYLNRRLRNATSRINAAFFVAKNQITPHRIWYNRVVKKPLTITQERSYSDTYDTI